VDPQTDLTGPDVLRRLDLEVALGDPDERAAAGACVGTRPPEERCKREHNDREQEHTQARSM
jgi:hypothetical protein